MKVYTFQASGPALINEDEISEPSSGNRVAWGLLPPTTGYWKVGDVFISSAPDLLGTIFTCQREGSPGDWAVANAPEFIIAGIVIWSTGGARSFIYPMTFWNSANTFKDLSSPGNYRIGRANVAGQYTSFDDVVILVFPYGWGDNGVNLAGMTASLNQELGNNTLYIRTQKNDVEQFGTGLTVIAIKKPPSVSLLPGPNP